MNQAGTFYCRRCKYDIGRLESRACPECGQMFDPDNDRTYLKSASELSDSERENQGYRFTMVFISGMIVIGIIILGSWFRWFGRMPLHV